jgi:enoyl-CoA hydratase/carnithine racemase
MGVALDLQLTGEPIDAQRALQCNLFTHVVPHGQLLESARAVAEQILANNQVAVHSAKQTTFDLVGRHLDDQLRVEALNGYSVTPRGERVIDAFNGSTRPPEDLRARRP